MSAVPKSATPLWPRMGLDRAGALDHVVMQYDRHWLRHAADQVAANMRGPLRHSVAEVLRQLADTPKAIDALKGPLNRRAAPQEIRGLNIAVHYLAAKELRDCERQAAKDGQRRARPGLPARKHVAGIWGLDESTIKDLNRSYAAAARVALDQLIELWRSADRMDENLRLIPLSTAERTEVLRLIEADMGVRASLPWMKAPKARGKTRRLPS